MWNKNGEKRRILIPHEVNGRCGDLEDEKQCNILPMVDWRRRLAHAQDRPGLKRQRKGSGLRDGRRPNKALLTYEIYFN